MDKILTDNLNFVDGKNRTRFFNGMNIDDKLLGGERFRYDLDDSFFSKYAARGFNVIRLAVTWASLEPRMGEYNESYLKSIDEIFLNAANHGVYILLDMHQDLFSGYGGIGAGDGAPQWAAITDGYTPKEHKFVWIEGYVWGKWVHRSFDHFWNNDEVMGRGLQDRFADLWKMLALRYGNSPALLGFDLFNEPFPGSDSKKMFKKLIACALREIAVNPKINRRAIAAALIHKDMPTLLDCIGGDAVRDIMENIDSLAYEFDRTKYSPFLNNISTAIREITPNGIIMIEQSFLCNGGVKQSVPPITVNGKREPLQCYGPHSYDMTVDTPLYKYANADRVKAFFTEMGTAQKRMNVPVIVGEWGGCSDNKDTSWFPHAFQLLDFFDENKWSQTYWDYHGDDLDSPLMEMLSRTYPVAVSGEVKRYFTERKDGVFTLEYCSSAPGESLIYVHKPAEIFCGGEAKTVTKFDSGARLISVFAPAGEHKIEVNFGGSAL